MKAATRAINDAGRFGYENIRINTDSQFVAKSADRWMHTWKQNGWHKSDGKPVVNRDDFQRLDAAMTNNPRVNVEWRHVQGHSGDPNNEAADRLAKEGAQRNYNGNRY